MVFSLNMFEASNVMKTQMTVAEATGCLLLLCVCKHSEHHEGYARGLLSWFQGFVSRFASSLYDEWFDGYKIFLKARTRTVRDVCEMRSMTLSSS